MSETREPRPSSTTATVRGGGTDDHIDLSVTFPESGQVVIAVGGEVDMLTSPQLRTLVLDQFRPETGNRLVVLDLDGVTFLGTSGLAVLIEVREGAHVSGVDLRLVCTARRVMRPLTIAGLVPLFDIHDSSDRALAAS